MSDNRGKNALVGFYTYIPEDRILKYCMTAHYFII